MIELDRIDPQMHPRLARLRPIDLSSPLTRAIFAVGPHLMPQRRVRGVSLRRERAGSVALRVYRPARPSGAGLLWIHGGGLVGGVAKMDDELCGRTALDVGVTVVSVEYRLAPRHPFPAAHDDVYAGWRWLVDHSASLGLDPDRLAVGGQSAGGGLAAGLVQRLSDDGERVAAQWLWTPMLDDRTGRDGGLDTVGHLVWDSPANRYGWDSYLRAVDRNSPPAYASPARRQDLRGLPPTWLYASDIELFRDEIVEYADRLRAAGVDTTLEMVAGVPHAVESVVPDSAAARAILSTGRAWLSQRLAPPPA